MLLDHPAQNPPQSWCQELPADNRQWDRYENYRKRA
jgi:hypothetical protein